MPHVATARPNRGPTPKKSAAKKAPPPKKSAAKKPSSKRKSSPVKKKSAAKKPRRPPVAVSATIPKNYMASGEYERDVELAILGNPAARRVIRLASDSNQRVFLTPVRAKSMRKVDRPTTEITRVMCLLVRAGNYPSVAARAIGVSMAKFNNWVEQALRFPNSVYADWFLAVDAADAMDECYDMSLISLMPKNWQAIAFKRSGKSAMRWGSRVQRVYDDMINQPPQIMEPKEMSLVDQFTVFGILEKAGYFSAHQSAADTVIDGDAKSTPTKSGANGKSKI